jgi:hypothetical protein
VTRTADRFNRDAEWRRFSDAERQTLQAAIVGWLVCPRGVIVKLTAQTTPLLERLR